MTRKEELINFINNLDSNKHLITNELLDNEPNTRSWFMPKEYIVELITNNFSDELIGDINDGLNQEIEILSWE